ncbi:MAG: DNA N-6-adenine-methyltransferase, partial [Candidatus Rokuibacteriota bacterium]
MPVTRPFDESRSSTHEWETPGWLFDLLHQEFKFAHDVCAMPWNAKCAEYFSPTEDGLEQPWEGACWMNPPYGRELATWLSKSWAASRCGATVVALVPARTETAWWHDYVMQADEVRCIRGRLHFSNSDLPARCASVIVVFRPGSNGPPRLGSVVRPGVGEIVE